MRILCLDIPAPGASLEKYAPHLNAEALHAWGLYKSGFIRDIYFRQDRPGVAIFLECDSVDEAMNVMAEFPLAKAGLLMLAMSSAAVSAAEGDESVTTTVNGGVIHFKGEVVNAACAIDSESMNQTVELGQVRSSRLAKAGDLSSAVGFNIKLNDCDTNVSSNAAVAFLGTTVTSNDDTLALQSSAAGSAQNVGIQILDRTGEVLILDGATFSAKTDLIDGTNILPFQARYIALGQSVAGTANADATFKVQYL